MTQRNVWMALVFTVFAAGAARAADAPAAPSAVVAKIGDVTLTEDQMRQDVGMNLYEAQNNLYQVQKNWVDQKAKQILFERAAKDAKMSRADWESKEINSHISMPSEDEIQKVLAMYTKQGGQNSNDPSQQAQQRQMVVGQLMNQRRMQREAELLNELEKKYPVQLSFAKPVAPKMDIALKSDDPVLGPKDAPVTMVEFTDYQCPYCKRSQDTVKQIEQAYKGKLRVISREYPLPFHQRAKPAAEAALCAKEQGKFWPYREKLFASQNLTDDEFKQFAKDVGLNQKKFDQCLTEHRYAAQVDASIAEGQKYGVRGTPHFFINGRSISGAQPFPAFDEAVKDALADKKS